jgi:hypothetical protein
VQCLILSLPNYAYFASELGYLKVLNGSKLQFSESKISGESFAICRK